VPALGMKGHHGGFRKTSLPAKRQTPNVKRQTSNAKRQMACGRPVGSKFRYFAISLFRYFTISLFVMLSKVSVLNYDIKGLELHWKSK
jgi:hypothetical protein